MDSRARISVLVLPRAHSDHNPLLLKCRESTVAGHRPFRFLNFWTNKADFAEVVAESWTPFLAEKDTTSVCVKKLKRLKIRLKAWSVENFGNLFLELEQQQQELSIL